MMAGGTVVGPRQGHEAVEQVGELVGGTSEGPAGSTDGVGHLQAPVLAEDVDALAVLAQRGELERAPDERSSSLSPFSTTNVGIDRISNFFAVMSLSTSI